MNVSYSLHGCYIAQNGDDPDGHQHGHMPGARYSAQQGAGTARHQTLRLISEQARYRRSSSLDEQAAGGTVPETTVEDVEEELTRLEEAASLYDALDRLELRCRELLEMLFFEDPAPDYREIANRTGLAVGSIGPIRARCLHRLKQLLKP